MVSLVLINEEVFDSIFPLKKHSSVVLQSYLNDLENSILDYSLPDNYKLFQNFSVDVINKCKDKAYKDIVSLKKNLALIDIPEWQQVLYEYLFEYKVNMLCPNLWFLGSKIELTNGLIDVIERKYPKFLIDISNIKCLKRLSEISDNNVNYYVMDDKCLDDYSLCKTSNLNGLELVLFESLNLNKINDGFKIMIEVTS